MGQQLEKKRSKKEEKEERQNNVKRRRTTTTTKKKKKKTERTKGLESRTTVKVEIWKAWPASIGADKMKKEKKIKIFC